MLGIGGLSRGVRSAMAEKRRDSHAAIAYDDPARAVTELPASAVYGKGR
jgi:hypothetical protein